MTPISGTQRRNTLFTLLAAIVVVFAAIAVSQAGPAHAATPTTASITITKAWDGGTAGSLPDAAFTTNGTGLSDFSLTEAAPSKTFTDLAPGDYSFTEGTIDGWTLTGVSCSDQPAARTSLAVSHTLNVTVAEGENLSCTFTNTMQAPTTGTLTVIKMVDNSQNPDAKAVPGDFMLSVMSNGVDVDGSPAAGSDTGTAYKLDPGTYNVSESGGPTGYASSFSGDCDDTGAVTLAAGDDLTCTITNTAQSADVLGNVTITKQWVPLDASTVGPDADFTATGSGTAPFTLTAADPSMSLAGVATGNYSFTEAAIDGWKLTAINCTGGSIADTIGINLSGRTLKLGIGDAEDVSCTFVNTEQAPDNKGSITIEKVWDGANGPEADFTTVGDGLSDFALTPDDNSQVFDGLNAGDYTFTETPQDGWTLTDISCSDMPSMAAPTLSAIHSVTITLAANEDVTCVFTNTPTGAQTGTAINITKVWHDASGAVVPGGSAVFTASGAGTTSPFTLTDASPSNAFTGLSAGTFTFGEAPITGWTLSGVQCVLPNGDVVPTTGDGTDATPVSFALADGQVINCVFTNTQQAATGSIQINKVWAANDGGTTGPDAVFTSPDNTPAGFTLTSATPSQMFATLTAGSYSFSEAAIDGWTLGAPVCTDTAGGTVAMTGDGTTASPLAVALTDGEVVTCTFTNTQQPATGTAAINITKVWHDAAGAVVPGSSAVFTATGAGTTGFTLSDATPSNAFTSLAAGNFSFGEDAITGWTLTSVACVDSGGNPITTTGAGTTASPTAFALADAQVINCVFTNTQANTAAVSPFDLSGLFPVTNTNPPASNVSDSTANTTPANSATNDATINNNGSTSDNGSTSNNSTSNPSTSNPASNVSDSTLAPVANNSTLTGGNAPAVAEATPVVPSTGSGTSNSSSYDLALVLGGVLAVSLGLASFAFTKRRD